MSVPEPCPFCAIGKNYPPSTSPSTEKPTSPSSPVPALNDATHIVLSTPGTIAFLDRLPLTRCHTLVIPRDHYELLTDFPSSVAADVGRHLPLICRAVVEVSGADGFNVVQNNGVSAGQIVPHAHFHVVPRFREASSSSMFGKYERRSGLIAGKGVRQELDDEEGIELSQRMRDVIDREIHKEKAKL
jgi:diadenosine tetraphosphate (Ap4A) HIT family hydrolase